MKKNQLALLTTLAVSCGCAMGTAVAGQLGVDLSKVQNEYKIPDNLDVDQALRESNSALSRVKDQQGMDLPPDVAQGIKVPNVEYAPQIIPEIAKDPVLKTQLGQIDLEKIAQQYNNVQKLAKQQKDQDKEKIDFNIGRAYLFVSSSMPKKTLENLMEQAGVLNIAVFLKGNVGDKPLSFKATQEWLNTLSVEHPPQLYIHPDAFKMFKVDRVPALVVAANEAGQNLDESGCADLKDYAIVRGDLKLGYQIEQIMINAVSPDVKDIAREYEPFIKDAKM